MIPFVIPCCRCGQAMRQCMCTAAMLMATPPPPDPPKTTVARFHKHGMFMVCDICQLTIEYCKGHALPEFGAGDGAESSLAQRIAEARQKAGGR